MTSALGDRTDPFVLANLGLRFLLEIAMLAVLAWTGSGLTSSLAANIAFAIALPVAAAGVWGAWVAPKASSRLTDPGRLLVELVLFAAAAAGLALLAHPVLAAVFAALVVANIAVLRLSGAEH